MPINSDIQEGPYDRTEDEYGYNEKPFHEEIISSREDG
jgi:hypothetical protein